MALSLASAAPPALGLLLGHSGADWSEARAPLRNCPASAPHSSPPEALRQAAGAPQRRRRARRAPPKYPASRRRYSSQLGDDIDGSAGRKLWRGLSKRRGANHWTRGAIREDCVAVYSKR
eukprot:scaffold262_cov230-Pinguiococcus_pyrenoidosus.AAC.20